MPDEKTTEKPTEEKVKRAVPGLVRSLKGIADHAAAVQERQYEVKYAALDGSASPRFKDPTLAMVALFAYAKLTPTIVDEELDKLRKLNVALETRLAAFETRLTTMEKWRDEAIAQNLEMVRAMEEEMNNMPPALREQIAAGLKTVKDLVPQVDGGNGNGKPVEAKPVVEGSATVTSATVTSIPVKPAKVEKGGAA